MWRVVDFDRPSSSSPNSFNYLTSPSSSSDSGHLPWECVEDIPTGLGGSPFSFEAVDDGPNIVNRIRDLLLEESGLLFASQKKLTLVEARRAQCL